MDLYVWNAGSPRNEGVDADFATIARQGHDGAIGVILDADAQRRGDVQHCRFRVEPQNATRRKPVGRFPRHAGHVRVHG